MVDDEILQYCFYVLEERPWDSAALDIDAIVEGATSGKGFLGTKHTRKYMHTEFTLPLLSFRGGLNEWVASRRTGLVDIASEKVAAIIELGPLGCPQPIIDELCILIDQAARHIGLAEWPDPRRLLDLV